MAKTKPKIQNKQTKERSITKHLHKGLYRSLAHIRAGKHARGERGSGRPNDVGEGAEQGGRGPNRCVGAQIRHRLKVAVPGWLPCRAGKYGVLEGLRGRVAPGAGCRVIVISGRVGAEEARSRSHLVKCNMSTCSGNGTQERLVQDLPCLVDLYLVYLI